MKISHLLAVIFSFLQISAFAAPIPWADLEKQLKGNGLVGSVHGASQSLELFVFTYREPGNFFSHAEFPLVAATEAVDRTLRNLNRHDEVSLKGYFIDNGAPIRHIFVEDLNLLKKYENPAPAPEPYPYKANLPDDLMDQTEIVGKVHAVAEEGKILVIEYKDAVVPVVVGNAELAKGLYRNDKIKLKIKVRNHPPHPTHVSLDLKAEAPLTVLDKMVDWHGKKGSVEGYLVLFPKSPQVSFNVFALQVSDSQGVLREFTLVNFENDKIFSEIRAKLQGIWDSHQNSAENGRNKLINRQVKLKATGTFNVVDPGQANPQVLLQGPELIQSIEN